MLKRILMSLAVAAIFALFLGTTARAQEPSGQDLKPIVTVAFSGYDALVGDLNFVGNLAGSPQLGGAVEMMVTLATGGNEIKSLDKSKPWGALAFFDGAQFRAFGFVPMADLDELKTILESNAAEIEETDDHLIASFNDQKLYLKGAGGWIFVSNQSKSLDTLPKDPAAALGGLDKAYNLAVRVNVQNVPEMVRNMLLDTMQMGMQAAIGRNPGESDEQFALRTKLADQSMEEIKRAVNELDAIQVGLAIDEKVPSIHLDIEVSALPDTETARRLTAPKDLATKFGGFVVPDATFSYNGVGRLESFHVQQFDGMVDEFRTRMHDELQGQGLPEDEEKTAEQLVDDGLAIVTSAAEERELDFGTLLLADGKQATWLAGVRVADGSEVEDLLHAVVQEATKESPSFNDAVQFNAAEHAGVRLHTLTIPTGELGLPQLSELFGEELVIVVGAADKAAYLSAGSNALERLKKAIDDSQDADLKLPPSTATVSVGAIAELVGKYVPDPQVQNIASLIGAKLADSKGKDRITIITTIPDNGQKTRIEIEEDLLQLLVVLPAILMGR